MSIIQILKKSNTSENIQKLDESFNTIEVKGRTKLIFKSSNKTERIIKKIRIIKFFFSTFSGFQILYIIGVTYGFFLNVKKLT